MVVSFRKSKFIIYTLLFLTLGACAQRAPESGSPTLPRVTMPDTEVRKLESSATGRSYDIYIRLPSGYAQNQGKKYPVLYVLDGQWDFKLLDSIYGGLLYDEFVPEMIIVGITYSGDSPDYNTLRAMDYTPVQDTSIPGSGGAPKFLAFFKEELIPFIEINYRVDSSRRVLMGSSFGGTFTLYAMFVEPGLFNGYVAASPVVVYGNRLAFKQEAEYAGNHQDLPVRLFLSVGELEDLARPVQAFMQVISKRGYTGLEMEMRTISGERHAGNKPEAFNRGLRFVFQNK
jgi:uncharacterized protein